MKTAIVTIAALIAAASLKAQTLGGVLESVEKNNTELKALAKGNEAARLDLRQANNLEGLSVEYSPFFNGDTRGIASSELVVTQGFDFPTLYGARRKAARLQGEAIDLQYRTARRDILLAAKQLCLDLIHMNKRRALLRERRLAADELLAMFTEKYEAGDATAIELNKIKMERMNMEAELAAAETDRATALEQLRAMNGGVPVECADTLYPPRPVEDYEAMYARAVASDWQVMAAGAAVEAAGQDVKVSRQGWMPKLEIGFRRNTEGPEASNGFLIGGSIPIFANRHKVKAAKARQAEAEMMKADARLKAESAARAAVESMRRLGASMAAYDVPLMRHTLLLLRKAVESGQMSVTDYYVEADGVYRNMQAYIALERQYQGLVADLTKNDL